MSEHPTLHRPGDCGCDCEWGGGPETCTVKVWVRGCFSKPLGGATVVSSVHGGTYSPGTDDPVTWSLEPGVPMTVTISHERFETVELEFECPGGGVLEEVVDLTPKSGYTCACPGLVPDADRPALPWKLPLRITDSQGTVSLSGSTGCPGTACASRTVSPVGAQCDPIEHACVDPVSGEYTVRFIPPPVGTASAAIWYELSSSIGWGWWIEQRYRFGGLGEFWPQEDEFWCADPAVVDPLAQSWICPVGCGSSPNGGWRSISGPTVNSVSPLNITFSFPAGDGWGPRAPAPSLIAPLGSPVFGTLVLSESP